MLEFQARLLTVLWLQFGLVEEEKKERRNTGSLSEV